MRFISVIVDPGKIWTDHQVVDLERKVIVAKCSRSQDADAIADALNVALCGRNENIRLLLSEQTGL